MPDLTLVGVAFAAENSKEFDRAIEAAGKVTDAFSKKSSDMAKAVNESWTSAADDITQAVDDIAKEADVGDIDLGKADVSDLYEELERTKAGVDAFAGRIDAFSQKAGGMTQSVGSVVSGLTTMELVLAAIGVTITATIVVIAALVVILVALAAALAGVVIAVGAYLANLTMATEESRQLEFQTRSLTAAFQLEAGQLAETNALLMERGVSTARQAELTRALVGATDDLSQANEIVNASLELQAMTGKDATHWIGALGKAMEEGSDGLVEIEGQVVAVTEVLDKLGESTAYQEAHLNTLGGQMERFDGLVSDIQQGVGDALAPAMRDLFEVMGDIIEPFAAATREGGWLFNIFVKLGAIVSWFAEKVGDALSRASQIINNWFGKAETDFWTFIDKAVTWGFELIANFAIGMMNAIATVLTTVFNQISAIFGFFLGPGSPPRILPDIDKWGAEAMNAYLEGFQQADFNILEKAQRPMKQALDLMVAAGEISAREMVDRYSEISQQISRDLSTVGVITDRTFERIAQQTGQFGDEIAQLTALTNLYELAVMGVAEAQMRLNAAQEKADRQRKMVSKLVAEYNELRRAGASDDILKAKAAEIEAAEDAMFASREEAELAEEDLEVAKEKETALKEQVSLQDQLVRQLQELARLQIQAAQAAPRAVGARAGMGPTVGGLGIPDPAELGTNIDTLMEDLKLKIEEKWQELLEIWRKKWDEFKEDGLEKLRTARDELVLNFSLFMLNLIGGIQTHLANLQYYAGSVWETLKTAVTNIWIGMQEVAGEIANWFWVTLPGYIETARAAIVEKIDEIKEAWTVTIPESIDVLVGLVGEKIDTFLQAGRDLIQGLWDGMKEVWASIQGWIQEKLNELPDWFKELFGIASPSKVFEGIGENVMSGFAAGLASGLSNIENVMSAAYSMTQPQQVAAPSAVPVSRTTNYNFDVNANYLDPQSPVQIRDDISALITLARMQ
jgi:hypothetical protein